MPVRPMPRYELILEPLKGSWPTPTVRRLAIILKRLGRAYGFRCVSAKELPGVKTAEGSGDAPAGQLGGKA